MYIYIYIYIYIYCHPQTDYFVVSQLISVDKHARRFKLGLKPTQPYIKLCIIPLSWQSTYVSSGIIRHYVVAFACSHFAFWILECSIHMKSFAFQEWPLLFPSQECSTPSTEHLYCHPQTDGFIVSQLINRPAGCFKLGLKPAQLSFYLRNLNKN